MKPRPTREQMCLVHITPGVPKVKRPTSDQMRLAAQALDNEGPALIPVATWLREQADEAELRQECRQAGVPVDRVRKLMKKGAGLQPPGVTPL